jgi:hypothetical protein
MIILHTRDALDAEYTYNSVPADVAATDLGLVHPMTGPVHINGAKRGDAIEVEIVDIVPDEYGYTVIVPGFGFMRDVFTEPYIIHWQLTRIGAVSAEMPGITVPYEAFPGSIGVLPGMPEIYKIKKREAALAGAGGAVLTPSPAGALPASICGKTVPIKTTVSGRFLPERMVVIWMSNKCRLELASYSLASSMVADCLQGTSITPKVTERSQGLRLKWEPLQPYVLEKFTKARV